MNIVGPPVPVRRHARRGPARGVSLIEALVAFAVLGFGMLGVVGMQATLRYNADIAKQRSEAVRIGQETLEDWRTFSVLDAPATPVTGVVGYSGIADLGPSNVSGYTTNTTYSRKGTVVASVPPGHKTLVVDVEWADRSGVTQSIRLSSLVAGVAPELAATLVAPGAGAPARLPMGRHRGIPLEARDFGNGTSGFIPPQPGGATIGWLFDNLTGRLKECTTSVQNTAALQLADLICNNAQYQMLLTGYVRYATNTVQPQDADVADANANGPDFPVPALSIVQTAPATLTGTRNCYVSAVNAATFRDYYCGVPIDTTQTPPPPRWSGSIAFAASLPIAADASDARSDHFRVCRYFQYAPPANTSYVDVSDVLRNQNFVIIRAGDGSTPFTCPAATWLHQP